jgi:xanthine dehydrogenase YagT iron-sulfur-binding subunit
MATSEIELTINGHLQRISLDPRTSLLDMLREHLALHGTKKGCDQGACGACTILLDGKRINSCLTLAVMHNGAHITTIEGLANGAELHPLQAAFIGRTRWCTEHGPGGAAPSQRAIDRRRREPAILQSLAEDLHRAGRRTVRLVAPGSAASRDA